MTPDLLKAAGKALYGPRWQTALAADLEVADRTVQRWAAGDSPIPEGVSGDVWLLLNWRGVEIADLLKHF